MMILVLYSVGSSKYTYHQPESKDAGFDDTMSRAMAFRTFGVMTRSADSPLDCSHACASPARKALDPNAYKEDTTVMTIATTTTATISSTSESPCSGRRSLHGRLPPSEMMQIVNECLTFAVTGSVRPHGDQPFPKPDNNLVMVAGAVVLRRSGLRRVWHGFWRLFSTHAHAV